MKNEWKIKQNNTNENVVGPENRSCVFHEKAAGSEKQKRKEKCVHECEEASSHREIREMSKNFLSSSVCDRSKTLLAANVERWYWKMGSIVLKKIEENDSKLLLWF